MKLTLVNLYPEDTLSQYLLSSYILKAYLDKHWDSSTKLEINVINCPAGSGSIEISKAIKGSNPDYIGYSCYLWNINKVFEVIRLLRSQEGLVHILGGPEIEPSWISSLPQPEIADYYVVNEGERKLLHLLQFLSAKKEGRQIDFPKGVARWEREKLVYREAPDRVMNLDEIPSIYLSGAIPRQLYARQQAFLETQRGCRYKCKYCVYHKKLSTISYYSIGRIIAELDHLIIDSQIMALRIFDAIFPSDLSRAKALVRHLIDMKVEKGKRLPWIYWEFRHDSVDEEFIQLTASLKNRDMILNSDVLEPLDRPQFYSEMVSDYTVINSVGIESCYKKALNAVGRPGLDVKKFTDFMHMVRDYNIALKLDLILGLPEETLESYFRGLEFLIPFLENTDHVLNIHRLQIIPGCALEKRCEAYSIEYSRIAPYFLTSSSTFSYEDMQCASRLSAVLFRILNSPLRKHFFDLQKRTGKSYRILAEHIYREITSSSNLAETKLVCQDQLDDEYWNSEIFNDITSAYLIDIMEMLKSDRVL